MIGGLHVLNKQIAFNGETYTEINFDLDNLRRVDLDTAEKITRARHGKTPIVVIELNKTYQVCLATMAADVPPGVFELLGARDYTQIALMVQDFLLGGESDAQGQEAQAELEKYLEESGRMKNTRKSGTPPMNPPV